MVLSIVNGRFGLEGKPDFEKKIVFHPIPEPLKPKVAPGENWEGRLGRLRETGRKDRKKRPIFSQVFIPLKKAKETEIQVPSDADLWRCPGAELPYLQAVAVEKCGGRTRSSSLVSPSLIFEKSAAAGTCSRLVSVRLVYRFKGVEAASTERLVTEDMARFLGFNPRP